MAITQRHTGTLADFKADIMQNIRDEIHAAAGTMTVVQPVEVRSIESPAASLVAGKFPAAIEEDVAELVDHIMLYAWPHAAVEALRLGADSDACLVSMLSQHGPSTVQISPVVNRIQEFRQQQESLKRLLESKTQSIAATAGSAVSAADVMAKTTVTVDGLETMPFKELRRRATYSGTVYHGGVILQSGLRVVIDISTAKIVGRDGALQPSLKDHDSAKPVGMHVAEIDTVGKVLRVSEGRFPLDNRHVREVLSGVQSGQNYPWQASVRGRYGSLRLTKAGQSVVVNGRKFDGPVAVARGFEWRETSWTGLGADQEAPRFEIEVL